MTMKPVASPILRICWLRPSTSVTSSQVLPFSRRIKNTSAGRVFSPSMTTPSSQRSRSASFISPATLTTYVFGTSRLGWIRASQNSPSLVSRSTPLV